MDGADEDEEGEPRDYETEYDTPTRHYTVQESETFMSIDGAQEERVVDYKIDEDHKIRLHDCDFFIPKAADRDDVVFDFREMYVTPLDADTYAIPKVIGSLPKKVFLMQHYRNLREEDENFILDFEQIYVIDCVTKSIRRADVQVL